MVPVSTEPKLTEEGKSWRVPAAVPEPLSATMSCPPAMFAAMVSWPARAPVCVGVKVTWIVQLPPAWMD